MKTKHVLWKQFLLLQLVAGLLLGLALSGCADLSAIRKFSEISTEAESYKQITEDFVKFPERQAYYREKDYQKKLADQQKALAEQKPGIMALHQGVAEYMKALGELANDDVISYGKTLDPLVEELKKSVLVKDGLIKEPTVDAFAALANLLAKAVTDAYRRHKLKEVIGKANPNLKTVISTQKNIIGQGYSTALYNEQTVMNRYYSNIIIGLDIPPKYHYTIINPDIKSKDKIDCLGDLIYSDKISSEKKAILASLRDEMHNRMTEIDHRKQAAQNYIKVLDNIQEGHQQLYDLRDKLSSEALSSTIKSYSGDIQKLFQAIYALK